MSTASIKSAYARNLKETIIVRRFVGSGPVRPRLDVKVRGKATPYGTNPLIAAISEGDQMVMILVDDLIAGGFSLPLTTSDFVVVKGAQKVIIDPGARKAPDGTLIIYEVHARG
jgi:hypothetical protein